MVNTIPERYRGTATASDSRSTLWAKYATAICGAWLAVNTVMSDANNTGLFLNDLICGIVICVIALASVGKQRDWLRWVLGALGTWLLFAPLVFWAPNAFRYEVNTLLGALVITFSFLIPGQPGAKNYAGPDIPPGWTYNPSSWEQRGPLIAIAFFGFFLAKYLAAYQLGYISNAWDPFFGNGTERVLESEISKAFIVSDAGLGAVSYLIDALEGFLGGQNRWRTMPWAVVLFAASIVPAGVTSIVLIMLQPIGVGAWCSICLIAAAAMLIMVPFAFDELVATFQFLGRARKRGDSFMHAFFFGGPDDAVEPGAAESSKQAQAQPSQHPEAADRGFIGFTGVNFPPTLLISAAVGAWIMSSPAVAGIRNLASDSQHLVGALIVTVAVTAMAEACRPARFLNMICGLWLMVSLFVLPGFPENFAWSNILAGIALIGLSIPRGKIQERYGTYDKYLV